MDRWIFSSKFVNEPTFKHNGEEVKLLSVDGIFATVEFNDGTQEEVYAVEVQRMPV